MEYLKSLYFRLISGKNPMGGDCISNILLKEINLKTDIGAAKARTT